VTEQQEKQTTNTGMSQARFQFRLRSILLVMTIAAIALAFAPKLTIGILIIAAGSAIVFITLWLGEQVRARFGQPCALPIGSMTLLSISIFMILFVVLPLPGGRGPVQYAAGDAAAMFVFELRIVAVLVMHLSPVLSGTIGLVRLGSGMPARFGWLIAAIVGYLIAWHLIVERDFIPTA
jgi:hypothetical protein